MPVYIVTYDLNSKTNRPDILGDIKEHYSWAKLSESSYAISTHKSADTVFSELWRYIDNNDRLCIITLKKPWAGFGLKNVNSWLDGNLEY